LELLSHSQLAASLSNTRDRSFPHPTTFLGDYSGIAATSGVVGLWADLRETVCFTVRCGAGEDAFFGAAP